MDVKTPVYFGVPRELFRKLTRKAREMQTSRSSVAGEAVRAYLASPFPVRRYRLERGEQFRRIATFLTAEEHAQLRALAQDWGTDESPVSVSVLIRAAVERFLGGEETESVGSEDGAPSGIIPTVPLPERRPNRIRRGRKGVHRRGRSAGHRPESEGRA